MNAEPFEDDLGADLRITKTTRRASAGGAWVQGTLSGYRFDALVFTEHADNPAWELENSRISKLWIAKLANRRTVFNWDRGMDLPAASDEVRSVVEFLCAGLADHVCAT